MLDEVEKPYGEMLEMFFQVFDKGVMDALRVAFTPTPRWHQQAFCVESPPMPLSRTLILLLCCCALALRMGGMHVHVGLDHEEAPHGLHTDVHVGVQHADMEPELGSVLHDHHEHEDEHPDHVHKAHAEVSLDNEALTKKFGMDTGLLLLAFLAILCWLLPVSGRELRRIRRERVTIPRCPAYLQPPLRGPPTTA